MPQGVIQIQNRKTEKKIDRFHLFKKPDRTRQETADKPEKETFMLPFL